MNKEELYKKALSNIHRYSLLNEIFAIRDERFSKEQQDYMLCVNGYIGIDTLNRYVRNIDELVEYQNIDTIENLKEKDKEIERLKAREEKISKMYLAGHKYASEMEGKYILAKYVIDELEKYIKKKIEDIKNNYSQVNGNYFNMNYVIETYEDVLNKLKELKKGK